MNKEIKLYDKVYFLVRNQIAEGIIVNIEYSASKYYFDYNDLLKNISDNNLLQDIRYDILTEKEYDKPYKRGSGLYFRNEGEVFLSKEDMKKYLINLID